MEKFHMQTVCYCLLREDGKRTYVGYTVNLKRRVRQHNGELVGGARRTHGSFEWTPKYVAHGFRTKNEAMSYEWHWKHQSGTRIKSRPTWKGKNWVDRRREAALLLIDQDRFSHIAVTEISPNNEELWTIPGQNHYAGNDASDGHL